MIAGPHAPAGSTLIVRIDVGWSLPVNWAPYDSTITVDYVDSLGPPDVTFMKVVARRPQGTETVAWQWTLGLDGTTRTPPELPFGIDEHNIAPTDSVERLRRCHREFPVGTRP